MLDFLLRKAPPQTFPGRNFVTPVILGYTRRRVRGRVAWVELSTGPGIAGSGDLYGVTFRRSGGGELWRETERGAQDDPSACFRSLREALDYIDTFRPV